MENLRASCRIHVVALSGLICLTLAYVAITDADPIARIFFGFFAVVLAVTLAGRFRKESRLAPGHLVGHATVRELKRGRRGRINIKYDFVALDGKQYQGRSDWSERSIHVGSTLSVTYNPEDPSLNQPLRLFLFYSLQPYGS